MIKNLRQYPSLGIVLRVMAALGDFDNYEDEKELARIAIDGFSLDELKELILQAEDVLNSKVFPREEIHNSRNSWLLGDEEQTKEWLRMLIKEFKKKLEERRNETK